MTGDPLDRIAAYWEQVPAPGSYEAGRLAQLQQVSREVLALVEVARAARDLSERCTPKDPALKDLRAALARLDGPR